MITEDRTRIAPYVSDVDGPVYSITGLPEEVVSVLFAYASRSPNSFRENLAKMIEDGDIPPATGGRPVTTDRARRFHEKWVINYGHSSVAEHTTIHIAVEGISRFASEILERANPHLSFTEKSQRYQTIDASNVYHLEVPFHLESQVKEFFGACFDAYDATRSDLASFIADQDLMPGASDSAIMRRAGEDARYLLPLATTTQLGLTGNARAISDTIRVLSMRREPEILDLADKLYRAASAVAPTLIRPWKQPPDKTPETEAAHVFIATTIFEQPYERLGEVAWRDYRRRVGPSAQILTSGFDSNELGRVILAGASVPWEDWDVSTREERRVLRDELKSIFSRIGPHDDAPPWVDMFHIPIKWSISEVTWHQLLRHRKILFSAKDPMPYEGTVPPRIFWRADKLGLSRPMERLKELQEKSKELADNLAGTREGALAVPYIVLNAALRTVYSLVPLGQLLHAARLRTSPRAQEEIRSVFESLISRLFDDAYLGPAAEELYWKGD